MSREIEAMKQIDEILSELQDSEDDGEVAVTRVLGWASAKYKAGLAVAGGGLGAARTTRAAEAGSRGQTPRRKAAQTPSMDKTLDLAPDGLQSWREFATEKTPRNVEKKGVVAVYYLKMILGFEKVTLNQVFTCFRNMEWRLPANFANTLQRAGSYGWLDTADRENILITPQGLNLVEHSLPEQKPPGQGSG